MNTLNVDIQSIKQFIGPDDIEKLSIDLIIHHHDLLAGTGAGNDFTGWVKLPSSTPQSLLDDVNEQALQLKNNSDVVVVVGIGGSYLGARAVIEALQHTFAPMLPAFRRPGPLILFAGNNISEDYHAHLIEVLHKVNWSLVVISKSGTTTEPAIAFRLLRQELIKKYSIGEARKRIVAITDKSRGALKSLANAEGYKTYDIPDDVGGRYSVLTPVGLLPIAVAGFDINQLIRGAAAMEHISAASHLPEKSPAALYAAARNALYRKGMLIEIMVNYQPNLVFFTEWWKQLYGESEGKMQRGIFPAGVSFTADLHSMGQYLQEGLRAIFETVLSVNSSRSKLAVPYLDDDADGLNFVAGKRLQEVNRMAELGTLLAHVDGQVPNIRISIPEVNEYYIGSLIYFFEFACALSGYILNVNPFDQPGVEAYKKNMFALLGKPGFETEGQKLISRLKGLV
ncbi:MAG: glucose-6-phosphate isomerase [Bacteroidales bacterium]|nr:glucose-6-phosphate isomerase [Bacteroidales bacterium]MDZ4205312.1 glucose-6-phosphate isomerase [Bacteroidales bacterium]